MPDDLRCPRCGRPCTSKSGITLHLKTCEAAMSTTNQEQDQPIQDDEYDPRDVDPRGPDPAPYQPQQPSRPPRPKTGVPFDIGAFFILNHVLVALDLNFADALGQYILDNGSDNRAILAFGHGLKKLSVA